MSDYGRERVTIVELDVPQCQKEYGTTNSAGTCNAILGPDDGHFGSPALPPTGTRKCFNTRATCQDSSNYLPATQVIRFSKPQRGLLQYGTIFPSVDGISTTPGAVNIGGMDRNISALGVREAVEVAFTDHQWNDHLFDKYRLERKDGTATISQSGTAQAGGSATLTLKNDAENAEPGNIITLYSGAGSAQDRTVSSYDKTTKIATVSPRWRQNYLRNSVMAGAVAGSPGTIPNTWTFSAHAEYTRTIVGTGTENGIPYIDIRFAGTVTGVRDIGMQFNSTSNTPASVGQIWTGSSYQKLVAGSFSNITSALQLVQVFNGAGSFVATSAQSSFLSSLNSTLTRLATTGTLSGSFTYVNESYFFRSAASGAVDFTIRIGLPQLEISSSAGDVIETSSSAVTLPDYSTKYEIFDPYDPNSRGTFWGKFIARNPYYVSYRARVLQGFLGDALEDMTTRSYIVDAIKGPSDGSVSMTLKDLFSLIEARKSVAPVASQGELQSGITNVSGSCTLLPSGIGDLEYPASGYVAIGEEVIAFTRAADVLTLTTRGALNTDADAHDAQDLVQLVLTYTTEQAHDIIYDLLVTYSGISSEEIPKTTWDILAASMSELYTAHITTPTAVKDLIGEMCEQAGCTVWYDPETALVQFQPMRATTASTTVDDNDWIVDGSLSVKRQDAKRVSRTLVYFGQINPTKKLEEPTNFRARVVTIDSDAEDSEQYGVPAIKEIFSRWIPQFGRAIASNIGERIIALFRDAPLEAMFKIYAARDGELLLAQPFNLQTFEVQDATGAESAELMAPVQIERDTNDIEIRAQGIKFFTPSGDVSTRQVYLDSSVMRNINLRTAHDSIYTPPVGGEVVEFYISDGFTVGSSDTSLPALRTGDWPPSVTLTLFVEGRVQGRGGNGGTGGVYTSSGNPTNANATPGLSGGLAFLAEYAIRLSGSGEIFGGGGGGAGGAASEWLRGGGGGGGGSGADVGTGGAAYPAQGGSYGADGSADSGGTGGAGGGTPSETNGGNGGGPALAGDTTPDAIVYGAAGGAAGGAISGVSFVTYASPQLLDVRGTQT